MSDRAVLGLFEDVEMAANATRQLLDSGFTGNDFDILSSAPYPHGVFGEAERHHNVYVFPLVGAAAGLITGILITAGTQLSFPLITGGKPILSIPPMLVIMYEGMMLGALIFTVLGVLFESRLPSAGARVYDPRITEGYIGVVVTGDTEQARTASTILRDHGAEDVMFDREGERIDLLHLPADLPRSLDGDPIAVEDGRGEEDNASTSS